MRITLRALWGLLLIAGFVIAIVLAVSLVTGSSSEAARYEVTVNFDRSATQTDTERVGDVLRSHDDDATLAIMESFPLIGRAVVTSDNPDLCASVGAALEGTHGVAGVSCGPDQQPTDAEPDAPVSDRTSGRR